MKLHHCRPDKIIEQRTWRKHIGEMDDHFSILLHAHLILDHACGRSHLHTIAFAQLILLQRIVNGDHTFFESNHDTGTKVRQFAQRQHLQSSHHSFFSLSTQRCTARTRNASGRSTRHTSSIQTRRTGSAGSCPSSHDSRCRQAVVTEKTEPSVRCEVSVRRQKTPTPPRICTSRLATEMGMYSALTLLEKQQVRETVTVEYPERVPSEGQQVLQEATAARSALTPLPEQQPALEQVKTILSERILSPWKPHS